MRRLSKVLVVLAALAVGGWIGGEMLAVRQIERLLAGNPDISAADVQPLREPGRIGVGLRDVALAQDGARLALPGLALWVPPLRLNVVHASLPPLLTLTPAGGAPLAIGSQGGEVSARLSPTHNWNLAEVDATAQSVTLDGRPLLARGVLRAQMTGFGYDAPRSSRAAYRIDADLSGLDLAGLPSGLPLTGTAGATGAVRVWLDALPGGAAQPQVLGVRSDGLTLTLDDLTAILRGRIEVDPQGFAAGEVTVDTADARGFLQRAADLGLIPAASVPLAAPVLQALATDAAAPTAEAVADAAAATKGQTGASAAGTDRSGLSFKTAQDRATRIIDAQQPVPEGMIRLTVKMEGGQMSLGPLPLGDAPRLR